MDQPLVDSNNGLQEEDRNFGLNNEKNNEQGDGENEHKQPVEAANNIGSVSFSKIKENIQAIKSLWSPKRINLPLSIMIGDFQKEEFVVEESVGGGVQDEIYEGFFAGDPSRRLLLKVFCGIDKKSIMKSFRNQAVALSRLSRLVKADYRHSLLVEAKMEGSFFNDLLTKAGYQKDIKRYKSLLKKYQEFPQVLKANFGLVVAMDPYNVIVDNNDNFHVLDLDGVTISQEMQLNK